MVTKDRRWIFAGSSSRGTNNRNEYNIIGIINCQKTSDITNPTQKRKLPISFYQTRTVRRKKTLSLPNISTMNNTQTGNTQKRKYTKKGKIPDIPFHLPPPRYCKFCEAKLFGFETETFCCQ